MQLGILSLAFTCNRLLIAKERAFLVSICQRVLIVLFTLFLVVPPAARSATADEMEWERLMTLGRYNHHPECFLRAVTIARRLGKADFRLHVALHNAGVECARSDRVLAESLFREDIALLEAIDVDFPELTCELYELALIYDLEGRVAEAEQLLVRALKIRQKWQDSASDHPYNAKLYALLHASYYRQHKYEKAAEALANMTASTQKMRTAILQYECLDSIAELFRNHASAISKRGSREETFHFLRLSLDTCEKLEAVNRPKRTTVSIVDALNRRGDIHLALGEYSKAEVLVRKALQFSLAENEPDLYRAGLETNLLSSTLIMQGKVGDVEHLQNLQLLRLAKYRGEKSPEYVTTLSDYAKIWREFHRPDLEAKFLEQRKRLLAQIQKD